MALLCKQGCSPVCALFSGRDKRETTIGVVMQYLFLLNYYCLLFRFYVVVTIIAVSGRYVYGSSLVRVVARSKKSIKNKKGARRNAYSMQLTTKK